MSAGDQSKYPKLAKYVKSSLPTVADVGVIASAMNTIGQLNLSKLRSALKWGSGPMIKVTPLPYPTYGEFTPDIGSNEVRLHDKTAQAFEDGKGLVPCPKGKVYLAGVVLLHELVHWGDDQDGVDRAGEEGKEFERKVYGAAITDTLFPDHL
jgi:hypothetical protein